MYGLPFSLLSGTKRSLLALMSAAVISWLSVTATQSVPLLYSRLPLFSRVVIWTLAMLSPSTSAKLPKSLSASTAVVSSVVVRLSSVEVGAVLAVTLISILSLSLPLLVSWLMMVR